MDRHFESCLGRPATQFRHLEPGSARSERTCIQPRHIELRCEVDRGVLLSADVVTKITEANVRDQPRVDSDIGAQSSTIVGALRSAAVTAKAKSRSSRGTK